MSAPTMNQDQPPEYSPAPPPYAQQVPVTHFVNQVHPQNQAQVPLYDPTQHNQTLDPKTLAGYPPNGNGAGYVPMLNPGYPQQHQPAPLLQVVQYVNQPQVQMTPAALFEANPKWKCCCGCHVTQGAQIIGSIYLACALLSMAYYSLVLLAGLRYGHFDGVVGFSWSLQAGNVAACACMLYGLHTANKDLMLPYLVLQGIFAVLGACLVYPVWTWYVVYCAYNYINEKPNVETIVS